MLLALVVYAHLALLALEALFVDLLQQSTAVSAGDRELVLDLDPVVLWTSH